MNARAPSTPVLWHFPVSHFNEKVRWALDFKGIPHARKALFLDYLPRALLATERPTLPILFLEGKAIGDSTRILETLETFHPDPPLAARHAEGVSIPVSKARPEVSCRFARIAVGASRVRLGRRDLPAAPWLLGGGSGVRLVLHDRFGAHFVVEL
jgi:Glutathione S-transferase, N-terminal domain